MNLCFEFLAMFRQKTGLQGLIVELPDRGEAQPTVAPTVVEALAALQSSPEGGKLGLLEQGRVAAGVLVFRKNPGGSLERIFDPEAQRVVPGQTLVLSVAMEGG